MVDIISNGETNRFTLCMNHFTSFLFDNRNIYKQTAFKLSKMQLCYYYSVVLKTHVMVWCCTVYYPTLHQYLLYHSRMSKKKFCIFPNPYTKVFRKNTESLKSSAQQPCEIFSLIIRKNFPRNPSCDWINVEYTCNCAFFNDKTRGFYYYFINQWTNYDRF